MNYAVHWEPDAVTSLTSIWLAAPDRNAVTQAQAAIDVRLALDPLELGQAVSEGLYGIEVYPLRALFEIHEDAHVISVVSVNRLV